MAFKIQGKKTATIPVGIAFGILASMTATLAGAGILAYLISAGKVGESGIGWGAMLILIVSSALGSWAATGSTQQRKLMVCGISGAGYYLSLLGLTAMFFGGQYQGMGVTALMVLVGSGVVVLLSTLKNSKGKTKHKIPAYR